MTSIYMHTCICIIYIIVLVGLTGIFSYLIQMAYKIFKRSSLKLDEVEGEALNHMTNDWEVRAQKSAASRGLS